jgi:hypothetical protein
MKTTSRTVSRVAFELLIVFFGVWGALWAENRREAAQDQDRAVRIVEGVITNLDTVVINWGEPFIAEQQTQLARWKESYQRGERPLPFYFRVPGGERGPGEIWDAAISSGALEVLDPGLVSDLGNFYREWDGMAIRLGRYHARTEELIYPGLGRGADWFYEADSSRLKPEYEGFMLQTEEVLEQWAERNGQGPGLRDRLSSVIEGLRR